MNTAVTAGLGFCPPQSRAPTWEVGDVKGEATCSLPAIGDIVTAYLDKINSDAVRMLTWFGMNLNLIVYCLIPKGQIQPKRLPD
jgi:hypothetical protein